MSTIPAWTSLVLGYGESPDDGGGFGIDRGGLLPEVEVVQGDRGGGGGGDQRETSRKG